MSTRPAYNLISQLTQVKLTKDEAKELIKDFDQVKESLTLGMNAIGELMAIAVQDENIGTNPESLSSTAYLISTLCDLIQGCNEQENDCISYVNGEFSSRSNAQLLQASKLATTSKNAITTLFEDGKFIDETMAISEYIEVLESQGGAL